MTSSSTPNSIEQLLLESLLESDHPLRAFPDNSPAVSWMKDAPGRLDLALGDAAFIESPVHSLGDRKLEVFRLIGEGQATSEVAARLGISVHTVDTYREKTKGKLGVKNAVELQHEAVRWVIEPSQP